MISGNKSHYKCGGYGGSWNCCQELNQAFLSVATPGTKLLYTLLLHARVSQILLTPTQYGENENYFVPCVSVKDDMPS
jgi:hypothetical protein